MYLAHLIDFPVIETDNFCLRQLSRKDAAIIFAYFSDNDVTRYYDFHSFKNIDQAYSFIENKSKQYLEGKGIRWGITSKKDSTKVIGTIGFHNWNKSFYRAEIGYELSKDYWGKGVMSEVLPIVLQYGFKEMNLNRIEALFHPDNLGSRKVLEKAGFKYEATLEEYVYMKGKFLDTSIMALIKRNFS